MPVANSAFSSPRATSPAASDSTLPCSPVITAASSPACSASSSRNLNSTAARPARPPPKLDPPPPPPRQRAPPPRLGGPLRDRDGGRDLLGRGEVDLGG